MEFVYTTMAVVVGMSFSLAVAILVEELIFGKVFGKVFPWLFARPAAGRQPAAKG